MTQTNSYRFYRSPSEKTNTNSYRAAYVENLPLTDDQKYLITAIEPYFVGYEKGIGKREVRALNRRFGVGATTAGLRAFVTDLRGGYEARNPFAVLWKITQRNAEL